MAESPTPTWVYAIRHGKTRFFKVGVTKGCPRLRLSQLQTGNPEKLFMDSAALMPSLETARALERAIIEDAKGQEESAHVHLEWLRWPGDLVETDDPSGLMEMWLMSQAMELIGPDAALRAVITGRQECRA